MTTNPTTPVRRPIVVRLVQTVLAVLVALAGVGLAGPAPVASAATAPPPVPVASVPNAGGFVNVGAVRLADTRAPGPNQGCVGGTAGGTKRLTLPAWLADSATVSALVVNITVVDPTADGFLRLAPAGSPQPRSVHINYSAGRSIANQVTIRPTAVSPADVVRKLDLWVSGGCPHVLVDLVGVHAQQVGGAAAAGGVQIIEPARVLDTRNAPPCVTTPRRVQVAGVAGVPAAARSVVLNVTALNATRAGDLTLSPTASPATTVQTIQFRAASSITNAVTTPLDATGGLLVSAGGGCPNLILDVLAWHSDASTPATGGFVGGAPTRLLDTRSTGGCVRDVRNLRLVDPALASSVSVALNVTVLDATAKGWLTVHSGGATPPGVASAQFVPGERIAHGLTVEPGADGSIDVRAFGGGCPHVLVDVLGHYAAPRVLEVQVGDQHTCVRSQGVTTQMRCWGGNLSGQLAYGPTAVSLPSPSTVAMGSAPLRIATGDDHTCAVLGAEGATAGNVWCSGANESGQLGDPTAWGREYQLRASTLTGAVDVAAGPSHTCAVVGADRRVRCVGANDRGQAPVEVEVPAPPAPERPWYCSFISCLDSSGLGPTPLTGVSRIAVGGSGSCAVLDSGRVRCWGLGVLGDAAFGQSSVAVEVPGITDAVDVSVGDDHACAAVLSGTTLRCWGRNDHGQLGQGGPVVGGAPVPVTVPGFSMVTGVSAGSARTCVEGFVPVSGGYDSRVACWGENSTGAVGDGTTTDRWSPVVVANGARSLRGVETGTSHTCVVADGRVECWGLNTSGQLGNGTRIDSPRPVVALD